MSGANLTSQRLAFGERQDVSHSIPMSLPKSVIRVSDNSAGGRFERCLQRPQKGEVHASELSSAASLKYDGYNVGLSGLTLSFPCSTFIKIRAAGYHR
ncbi:hypothetical protein [Pectobacterium versatile]|uniref:hypothetical protein n=1 Tax=Pectobacterium versatile TaxID=2488639 RepID=UPI001CCE8DB3|nr:hypothetical protein [Pectobacterium versatile]